MTSVCCYCVLFDANTQYTLHGELIRIELSLDQEQVCRKLRTQATVREQNPTRNGPKLRTAERTRREKLGFLDKKPSFQPKIIHQVPDFSTLHKALQTEALKKMQSKDVTKCRPFFLRTSARPARQSMMSPNTQVISSVSRNTR